MEANIKAMLLNKLNDYKKGQDSLRRGDHFCCLGVLCDIYREATGNGTWDNSGKFIIDSHDLGWGMLPRAVKEWAQIKEWEEDALITVNDSCDTWEPVKKAILDL